MNAPTRVAQVGGAASGSKPVRISKIEKPASGQAVTADASYDGTVKIDFGAVANEKITLVHVGETLIILFDNQSTVTIIPFFDSMGVPLANISVELNGKEFSSTDFASTFPITTDQSVLPAAGDGGAAGAPSSGANFANASVDPLNSPNPLPLLGPEELLGIQFTRFEAGDQSLDLLPSTEPSDPVATRRRRYRPAGFLAGHRQHRLTRRRQSDQRHWLSAFLPRRSARRPSTSWNGSGSPSRRPTAPATRWRCRRKATASFTVGCGHQHAQGGVGRQHRPRRVPDRHQRSHDRRIYADAVRPTRSSLYGQSGRPERR